VKKELHTRETPEFLRSRARRDAQRIGQYRWRPTKHDLANLKASTKDPFAYLTMLRAWRLAGFKVNAIRRLANRNPRERISPPPPARTSWVASQEQLQLTR